MKIQHIILGSNCTKCDEEIYVIYIPDLNTIKSNNHRIAKIQCKRGKLINIVCFNITIIWRICNTKHNKKFCRSYNLVFDECYKCSSYLSFSFDEFIIWDLNIFKKAVIKVNRIYVQ